MSQQIPIHDIQKLTENEVYFILKKYYEKNSNPINFGDTIRLLNQITLKRYFRQIGKENWDWTRNSYFIESIGGFHKRLLIGLKCRKLITFESENFLYNGKKYNIKGKETFIKIVE